MHIPTSVLAVLSLLWVFETVLFCLFARHRDEVLQRLNYIDDQLDQEGFDGVDDALEYCRLSRNRPRSSQ
jgi:hypothetical protein